MPTPSLRDLQLGLRELIFTHAEVRPETRDLIEAAARALSIRGDDRLSAGERVLIYGQMHLARICEAIAEDFPALARALGHGSFDALLRAYLRAHPTDDCSLRRAARHLPDFLDDHPELTCFAAQADLARLEWAMIEAFDAADQTPLSRDELGALPPENWPDLALQPIRALVLLELACPADDLHAELLAREGTGDLPARSENGAPTQVASNEERIRLRVWRQSLRVFSRRMSPLEAGALAQLHADPSFSALCDWIAHQAGETDPAARAAGLLDLWLQDELLVRLPTLGAGAT